MVQEKNDTQAMPAALRRPQITPAPVTTQTNQLQEQSTPSQRQLQPGATPDISYEIKGEGSQFIEIKLRPGQSITGEISALMYYENGISMKMRTGSSEQEEKASFLQKLLGLGKAVASGKKLFMMHFTNTTAKELIISFSMSHPGNIVPISLSSVGGKIFCQNDAFLCATNALQVSTATPKELGGSFLNSAISMQKIEGNGTVFLFCGGSLLERTITQGSIINVTTGTTLAVQPGVSLKIKTIRNVGVTGQGHMITELSGSGHAWFQSLPFKRQNDKTIESVGMFFGLKAKKKNPVWGK